MIVRTLLVIGLLASSSLVANTGKKRVCGIVKEVSYAPVAKVYQVVIATSKIWLEKDTSWQEYLAVSMINKKVVCIEHDSQVGLRVWRP